MNPEEYFKKDYIEFSEVDPFNSNEVSGYLSRHSDDTYGALLIENVNGESCPQLILCTPKMRYPFDKQDNWNIPKAKRIERYEKLDGTNIFQYRYKDHHGNTFISYKTRLRPFVGDSRFGPFKQMVMDFISKMPSIAILPNELDANISYEIWGARNPHLVKYTEPLELSLLFCRKKGKVYPPSLFDYDFSIATFLGIVTSDFIEKYKIAQGELENNLEDTGDGYYKGREGEVWYLLTEDNIWQQFKCKPETIETIHWAHCDISKNQILATCENAFENWETPTPENIALLLLEEFPQQKIDKVHYRIPKYLDEVFKKHIFIEKAMNEYNNIGINILKDKGGAMRALSSKFKRNEMRWVYSIIMSNVTD